MTDLSTVQTQLEARIFEQYKHLELERYACIEKGNFWDIFIFFTDGSYRRYWHDPSYGLSNCIKAGRFRHKKTGKFLAYESYYNKPTFVEPHFLVH